LPGLGTLPCRAQVPPPVADAPGSQPLPSPRPTTSPPEPETARGVAERTPTPQQLELPARPSQKSSLELPPPPGGETVKLELPPLEPGDLRFPINLATALRLADARPLLVAAAAASAWVAEAQLQKAKVLWLPDFQLGFVYLRHDGFGPDVVNGLNVPSDQNIFGQFSQGSFGKPLNQNINFFYTGGAFFQF